MVEQRQESSSSLSTPLVTDSYTSLKFVRYKIDLSFIIRKKKKKSISYSKVDLFLITFLVSGTNQPTQTKHSDQNIYPTRVFAQRHFSMPSTLLIEYGF